MNPLFYLAFGVLFLYGLFTELKKVKPLGTAAVMTYLGLMVVTLALLVADKMKVNLVFPTSWLAKHVGPWVRSIIPF